MDTPITAREPLYRVTLRLTTKVNGGPDDIVVRVVRCYVHASDDEDPAARALDEVQTRYRSCDVEVLGVERGVFLDVSR